MPSPPPIPPGLRLAGFVEHLLDAIEREILPLTRKGVAAGDKVFGAALLRKSDGAVVLAETNHETENPLWHGEVHCLKRYGEQRAVLPPPAELLFLSTHEPCSMCLSAITWAGFDNFFYLFSHEDSRDAFAIPHDLEILREVFGVEPGGYRRENAFWRSFSIRALVAELSGADGSAPAERIMRIEAAYAALSAAYQSGKGANAIPLR